MEGDMDKIGWKSWHDKIYDTAIKIADQSSEGDTINACYSVDFAQRLKKYLLPYTPLWTAIMVPVFGRGSVSATSAAVEAEFSDLKHRDFRGEIPMRVDRFVMQHLERIDEKIKERSNESDGFSRNPENKELFSENSVFIAKAQSKEESKEVQHSFDSEHRKLSFGERSSNCNNDWNVKEEWGGYNKNIKRESQKPSPKRRVSENEEFPVLKTS
ncbi:hypothetical protein PYW07_007769 [Mythimna separata]|uniref:Uncharacterized protein n=1 Tax=Mythimna separata TaxID=271217 RepID=A0AAD7YQ60_MYTSE|nr:hypothetical protein PYW07_007769 [Mythimna separata]